MRNDAHPEDFLELSSWMLTEVRMSARNRPIDRPYRELTIDDLQRFVGNRMDETCGPAALVVRQKAMAVIAKRKAVHRLKLRLRWAEEDEEASSADLFDTLEGILDGAESGDVDRIPMFETTDVATRAVAEAIPANYTSIEADKVIALAAEHGFTRLVDHTYADDGTTRITLIRPPQSPFGRSDIQSCVEVKQREMLSCSIEQRIRYAMEAFDLFDRIGGVDLLPTGETTTALMKRIAKFRQGSEVRRVYPLPTPPPQPTVFRGGPSQPTGP